MLLIGALSNHAEKLERLGELRQRLLAGTSAVPRLAGPTRPRSGALQAAVIQVLAKADRAMSVAEVHVAVQDLLRIAVSKDSVNSCLSVGAKGMEPVFERVKLGVYLIRLTAF